jgi:hypothetical protein
MQLDAPLALLEQNKPKFFFLALTDPDDSVRHTIVILCY